MTLKELLKKKGYERNTDEEDEDCEIKFFCYSKTCQGDITCTIFISPKEEFFTHEYYIRFNNELFYGDNLELPKKAIADFEKDLKDFSKYKQNDTRFPFEIC